MRFSDIVGQQAIKDRLINSYLTNRVSHAYLFYGLSGSGKLALALAFAQYLSCDNKQDGDSCGECRSCKKYQKLIHPDLHFVFPIVSSSGAKSISDNFIAEWREQLLLDPYFSYNEWMVRIGKQDKQGSIYADESSEILRKLSFKSFESKYKIMIIWLPEKMNITCANKLLKILEEPPANTVFFLVSDKREEVLPTILSRTQPVKILGIDDDSLQQAIMQRYNLSETEAADIVRISNGSMTEAKEQITTSEIGRFNLEKFIELMRLTYSRNIEGIVKWTEEMAGIGREKQKMFLNYALIMVRESFIYNLDNQALNYITNQEAEFANKFARFVTVNNVEAISESLNKAHFYIGRNGDAAIVFADTAYKIMRVIRS